MTKNITVIFTCYNRKEQTVKCVNSLINGNKNINFDFIIVDDHSSDGTVEALREISNAKLHIINGSGDLYWAGGMRKGISYFIESDPSDQDLCLLANDDVEFYDKSIEGLVERLNGRMDYLVVGATDNKKGDYSYGLKVKSKWYTRRIMEDIHPSKAEVLGEIFNANCVLIPNKTVKKAGTINEHFTHGLGDLDYGYRLGEMGIKFISSEGYIGQCENNTNKGTWKDPAISRRQRLKMKELPKGDPINEWWYFLMKHHGFPKAVITIVKPYIRILIKR